MNDAKKKLDVPPYFDFEAVADGVIAKGLPPMETHNLVTLLGGFAVVLGAELRSQAEYPWEPAEFTKAIQARLGRGPSYDSCLAFMRGTKAPRVLRKWEGLLSQLGPDGLVEAIGIVMRTPEIVTQAYVLARLPYGSAVEGSQ